MKLDSIIVLVALRSANVVKGWPVNDVLRSFYLHS